jgi:hypothetical protein
VSETRRFTAHSLEPGKIARLTRDVSRDADCRTCDFKKRASPGDPIKLGRKTPSHLSRLSKNCFHEASVRCGPAIRQSRCLFNPCNAKIDWGKIVDAPQVCL